jgi:hypothetical protein
MSKPQLHLCPLSNSNSNENMIVTCSKDCVAYTEKFNGGEMCHYWRCTAVNSPWRRLDEESAE